MAKALVEYFKICREMKADDLSLLDFIEKNIKANYLTSQAKIDEIMSYLMSVTVMEELYMEVYLMYE